MTVMSAAVREEWLRERMTYIGASEAAEAVGMSPWGDPIGLFEKKRGLVPEKDATFRMQLGLMIEPIIGKLFTEQTGLKLRRPAGQGKIPPRVIRHPDHPFIGSNPDFEIVGGGRMLVQAKLDTGGMEWGEPGKPDAIPVHYRIQGDAEMLVTGAEGLYFAKLNPFEGLTIYPLARDEEAIEDLRLDLVDYWTNFVVPGVVPPPSAGSSEALARRYPKAEIVGKVASAEQEEQLAEILVADAAYKEAEERREAARNVAKAMIGTAAYIEGAGRRFSWSNVAGSVRYAELTKAYRAAHRKLRETILKLDEYRLTMPGGERATVPVEDLDLLVALASGPTNEEFEEGYRGEPSRRFTISKA
jgi:predicted phage-related endonuclease